MRTCQNCHERGPMQGKHTRECLREQEQAYRAAQEAYAATHPAPTPLDFPCPRCKASIDVPCYTVTRGQTLLLRDTRKSPGREFHLGRQDRAANAFNDRALDISNVGDNAINEVCGFSERYRTDHHTRRLRKVTAR